MGEEAKPLSYSMQQLLRAMSDKEASDLHITAGSPPQLRLNGDLVALPLPELGSSEAKTLCYSVMTESQRASFQTQNEIDFSFGIRGVARFRGNVFRQRGSTAGAFRLIPSKIRSFEDLGLPPIIQQLAERPRGLILVTGPTGSGKSTTLASIIDYINRSFNKHIITIEDPIEYVHENKSCIVNQREIGSDTQSYHNAMRYILRQDPDVVLLGELRDLESIETALTLAETGHLVFSTLHTNSTVQTINRIIDVFPAHQQEQVRSQLSFVLEAVLCQQLLPRMDGSGRVMALEIMVSTGAIRNLIREEKVHQIYSQLQVGQKKSGMLTLNQSLLNLYNQRIISLDDAVSRCSDIVEFRSLLGAESRFIP
ncbi:MAG: type IV pilus twitching motility protein PilT [Bradymonadales bacterium]